MVDQLSFEDHRERIRQLAIDPAAQVMVFIDGQNLYKTCQRQFGHGLCHPHLLAEHLAGPRTAKVVTRFYTGKPDRNIDEIELRKARSLDRRLSLMGKRGVRVVTRPLRYHWRWSPAKDERPRLETPGPDAGPVQVWMEPHPLAREKGIDLRIGLDVVEFALDGLFDVAIIVSLDADLHEIPRALETLKSHLPKPVRVEAAVPIGAKSSPKILPRFAYTHQITADVFERVRDDADYSASDYEWMNWLPPANLGDLG